MTIAGILHLEFPPKDRHDLSVFLFTLRKIIPPFFQPFGLSLILLALGILLKRRLLAFAGLSILVISSLPITANLLANVMEQQYPHLTAADCPRVDAVVVLGGVADQLRRYPDEIEWNDSVDRFEAGVSLFRAQKAPLLLFTGAQQPTDERGVNEGEMLRKAAIEHGVPPDKISVTGIAATTAEESNAVKKYLDSTGGHRIILVTSAYHMRRSAFLFRRAGVDVIPFPVDYAGDKLVWNAEKFIPSGRALALTEQMLREFYGNVLYRTTKP